METRYDTLRTEKEKLQSLLGLSQYQEESEPLRDYLKELQSRYKTRISLQELRKRLDQALGDKELSQALRDVRRSKPGY